MTVSFDRQAADFDLRAGLPEGVAARVAAALAELAPAADGVVLDVGAGTGLIGEHLARVWGAGERSRYLGMDVSGPMLAVFHEKLAAVARSALVRADAAAGWPIASGSVEMVFVSRAAHLLPPAVLVEEALRVARPGGAVLVFGGVRSPPDSLRSTLRREMRRLLAEQGVEGRNAQEAQHRLAASLAERGGEVLPARTAATWAVVERAGDALAAWRAKEGLGGRAVSPEIQGEVLRRLEDWIRQRFGGLEVTREATERYELAAIRLSSRSERNPRARP
jgi:SAM-dependent methyltransferase